MGRKRNTQKKAPESTTAGPAAEEVKLFKPINKDGTFGCTRGNEIVHQKVDWLVPGWIHADGVTLIGGKSGVGKSTFLARLAAQVAGNCGVLPIPVPLPMTTLWYGVEESVNVAIGPRLQLAGTPLSYVAYPCHGRDGHLRDRLYLPGDLSVLRRTIDSERAKLVVFDPITSFLGEGFSPIDNLAVRQLIESLDDVARKTGCSICITLHDRKGSDGSTVDHFGGGAAWTQTPRLVTRFARDTNHPDRFIVLQELNRLSAKSKPRWYTLERKGEGVVFKMGDELDCEIEDVCGLPLSTVDKSTLAEAKELLIFVLRGGPKKSSYLGQLAQADGISWGTLRRAKVELKIQHIKKSEGGSTYTEWNLPESLISEQK